MLIKYDPDEYKTVIDHKTCPYHQHNPRDRSYAGCTCVSSYSTVRRSPEEIREIKAKKKKEYEDDILAKAEMINHKRKMEERGDE